MKKNIILAIVTLFSVSKVLGGDFPFDVPKKCATRNLKKTICTLVAEAQTNLNRAGRFSTAHYERVEPDKKCSQLFLKRKDVCEVIKKYYQDPKKKKTDDIQCNKEFTNQAMCDFITEIKLDFWEKTEWGDSEKRAYAKQRWKKSCKTNKDVCDYIDNYNNYVAEKLSPTRDWL